MTGLHVRRRQVTVHTLKRDNQFDFSLMYLAVLFVGVLVAGVAWKRSFQPYIGMFVAVLLVTWLAWFVRPRLALMLTLFLALLGDTVTVAWFPFNKNLSSRESIAWWSDGFSFSPLEVTLVVALIAVPIRRWARGQRPFARSELGIPMTVVLLMILFGFANGMGKGGDLRAAIFELRPLLYFSIIYMLTISVCDQLGHYRRLLYTAFAAVSVQSLLSMQYALSLDPRARASLQSLTEHGSAISMNLLFVALIMSMAIHGCSWVLRVSLLLASIPAMWVYLLSQRRVAIVTLIIALVMFGVILFWRQRRTFMLVVPIMSLIGIAYVGAFWNATGPAGFPAQAVKTVIAPNDLSVEDQQSDQYRTIENFNLQATIRSSPIRGTGFGLPFQRPIPLADISVFEFNAYIPHNSLLWMWIKTGLIGIVAFLYLIARGVVSGVDRVRRETNQGADLLVASASVLFVVMFAIYLFVDIAWEPRNSVLLGVCLAMCTAPFAMAQAKSDDQSPGENQDERSAVADNPAPSTDRDEVRVDRVDDTVAVPKLAEIVAD